MKKGHAYFMQRALSLSRRGQGRVSPNPCVGAVIVKGNKIVGEGFHSVYGGSHAEIEALNKAGPRARGATLYITLEPCTHWGKTPPCAPQVIKSGIKRAYIAMKDPNPVVAGRGVKALERAGIRVQIGLEEAAARELNRPYLVWREKKRPYVILKLAMTLDGKIATKTGESKWITGVAARRWVHQLRSRVDGILVGRGTVTKDDPGLTSHGAGKNPTPIILDPSFKSSLSSRVFHRSAVPAVVFVGPSAPKNKVKHAQAKGHIILRETLKIGKFKLRNILSKAMKYSVYQLLVEGGGETAWSFLTENLVDEIYLFLAPKLLGGRNAIGAIGGAGFGLEAAPVVRNISIRKIGNDVLIHGYIGR